jgi:serine/threonine protein kinase
VNDTVDMFTKAMKLSKSLALFEDQKIELQKEVEFLKATKSENIIKYFDSFIFEDHFYIIFELCIVI